MRAQRIPVVGGAGYIGSRMVKLLGLRGCRMTTLGDLFIGHRDAALCGEFVQGNFDDRPILEAVISRGFNAVMRFASLI